MSKQIILSNGSMTVALDNYGQVQGVYYPETDTTNYLGYGGNKHKIGIYSEEAIHWIDDGAWKVRQDYYPGRLIGRTIANNLWLDIRLEIQDYADAELDVFARNIHVVNLSGRRRNIKLFLHQSFDISGVNRRQDTAMYVPGNIIKGLGLPTILHYFGRHNFLISGQCCNNPSGFKEFSIGRYGKYDNGYMSGVWCDAADGTLAGNRHDYGLTDSIIGFDITLEPHDSAYVDYYLSAGDSMAVAGGNLHRFTHEGANTRTKRTAAHWLEWIQPSVEIIKDSIDPAKRYDVINGLVQLRSSMLNNGAVTTVGNFNNVVAPVTAITVAKTFADYGLDIDAGRICDFFAPIVSRDTYLLPTYESDGSAGPNNYYYADSGDTQVSPINLTDTANFITTLVSIIRSTSGKKSIPADWKKRWNKIGLPLANFLADYIDPITKQPLPSFDDNDQIVSGSKISVLVHNALMLAAAVCEQLNDTDSVIKLQTAAEDIRENMEPIDTQSPNITTTNHQDNDPLYQMAVSLQKLITDSQSGVTNEF